MSCESTVDVSFWECATPATEAIAMRECNRTILNYKSSD